MYGLQISLGQGSDYILTRTVNIENPLGGSGRGTGVLIAVRFFCPVLFLDADTALWGSVCTVSL